MLIHSAQIIVYTYDIFKSECNVDDNKPVPSLKEYNKIRSKTMMNFLLKANYFNSQF